VWLVYSHAVGSPGLGFWRSVWEEDIRWPLRDVIRQIFFVLCTISLEFGKWLLGLSAVPKGLQDFIGVVFDGLTATSVSVLAAVITVGMIRYGWRSMTNRDQR
jgi:hypothetical protein